MAPGRGRLCSEIGGRQEGFEIARALRGLGEGAVEAHDRKARGWESMVHDGPRRLVAVAGNRHGKVFRHRIVADDEQRARSAITTDDGEIACGILAVERVEE